MHRKPRDPQGSIFQRSTVTLMLISSVWLAVLIIGAYRWSLYSGRSLAESMTIAFVLLVVAEFVKAYNFRSDHISAFRGTFKNRWLNGAIAWELILLLALVYVPFFQKAFSTFALALHDWTLIIGMALTIIPVLETAKWMVRRGYFGSLR